MNLKQRLIVLMKLRQKSVLNNISEQAFIRDKAISQSKMESGSSICKANVAEAEMSKYDPQYKGDKLKKVG